MKNNWKWLNYLIITVIVAIYIVINRYDYQPQFNNEYTMKVDRLGLSRPCVMRFGAIWSSFEQGHASLDDLQLMVGVSWGNFIVCQEAL